MALEVLDEAPAVDVLEDDAQLPVHALEVEDAADVLVVENGVAPRLLDEEAQVLGLGRLELLDDDRPLEAGLPEEEALAHGAHAAGAQLVEDAVLRLGQSGAPRGSRRRIAEPPGGVKAAEPDAILAEVRVMALDVGDVRIGVALSDETGTLASGLVTLRSVGPRKDAQAVAALAREHDVGEVVVGLPLRLDGSLGSQAEKVVAFVERLRRVLRLPVVTRDERLTSVAADERLAEAGVKRRDRKARIDQAAAALILQEHLDERKRGRGGRRRGTRVRPRPALRARRPRRRRWPRRVALSFLALAGPRRRRLARRGGTRRRSPKIAEGAPAVRLVVPPGASAEAIARQLHALGLVRHPLVFRVLARVRGVGARLKAGEYALSGPLSLEGILDAALSRRRRAARPDRPRGAEPRRDRRPRGRGGARARGVSRGRPRPGARARPRPRGRGPRGLPLPGHLRRPAGAGGAAGARAAHGAAFPRGDRAGARRASRSGG